MDLKQMDALRAQLMGSEAMEQNMGGQSNQQPNVVSPNEDRMTTQQRLREEMQASRGKATTSTVMTQGETYNPQSSESTPQAEQPAQTVQSNTTTIINTTKKGGKDKPLNLKVLGIGIGAIALVVFLFVLLPKFSGGNNAEAVPTPEPTPDLVWMTPEPVIFSYTPEELAELRKVGYTADEIETHQSYETPASDLIKSAEAEREAWLNEVVAPLYDTASDEYKESISDTWLSLPEVTYAESFNSSGQMHVVRKNLDYEKIKNYGHQLYVKIYLDDNEHSDYFFLCVTPTEWQKLNDYGNVIVNYNFVTQYIPDPNNPMYVLEDMENIFITGATLEIIE